MQIMPFEAKHVTDVTRLVNAQIASVPPYWSLSEEQVLDILQKESLWEIHYADEPPPTDWHNEILCVVENDHVLAAARFDNSYARWLISDPQFPAALDLLLDYLIAKRGDSDASIHIGGRSDFGIGWSGVPISDKPLNAALEAKGFVADQKWFVMTAEISHFVGDTAPLPKLRDAIFRLDSLHSEWAINESRLEWHLNLYRLTIHDQTFHIGECQSWGLPPEFTVCPDYNDWMQIEWLSVEDTYRRQGLARYLMIEQFRYQAARGKRYCFAYTSTDNTATINLNTSLGFTTQAEVWGWSWPYKL